MELLFHDDVVTITKFGKDDYDIFWHNGDCSVRGSATEILDEFCEGELDKIKRIAYEQWSTEKENPSLYVECKGMAVTNPWIDFSARFELSDIGALEQWGMKTVFDFCLKAKSLIRR